MSKLKECPFCGGKAAWCDTHDTDDIHECHFIVCTGKCRGQFDMVVNDDAETIEELKVIARLKWNKRVKK